MGKKEKCMDRGKVLGFNGGGEAGFPCGRGAVRWRMARLWFDARLTCVDLGLVTVSLEFFDCLSTFFF